MREEELCKLACIYENQPAGISVYHGELTTTRLPIIIKELQFHAVSDASEAVEEALKQTSLNAHPNVVTVYGVALGQRGDKFVVSLAIEKLDTDLYQEIGVRAREGNPWSESQLWAYLHSIIGALEYAQKSGLCHRDIKPQNLFLKKDGTIKVGDFGSAKHFALRASTSTLKGSPYFLSPALKRAYLQSQGRVDLQVEHNMFKSDVYSFGLTWLYMAKLGPSMGLAKIQGLAKAAREEIAALPYSADLKGLLGYMLEENESFRPDFCTIKEWISPSQAVRLFDSRISDFSTDVSNPRPSLEPADSLKPKSPSPDQSFSQPALALIPEELSFPNPWEVTPNPLPYELDFNPADLTAALNSEFSYKTLARLVLNQGSYQLLAEVLFPVKCQYCANAYNVAFTQGFPSVSELLFCSQTCLQQFAHRPSIVESSIPPSNRAVPTVVSMDFTKSVENLQEELKASFHERKKNNICIECGTRPIKDTDFLSCSKCINKQERTFLHLNSEACCLCDKKWPKQSTLSKLFKRKVKAGHISLPCTHKLCSLECLRVIARGRVRCPKCDEAISEKFLRFMKVGES